MSVTIWHNPRCSKSRQTLALLQERDIAPVIRLYLDDAPTPDDIRDALKLLGLSARELMRTKEAAYRDQGLADVDDEAALIQAMADTPKLIERPVVFSKGQAAVGRPPEAVLDIL